MKKPNRRKYRVSHDSPGFRRWYLRNGVVYWVRLCHKCNLCDIIGVPREYDRVLKNVSSNAVCTECKRKCWLIPAASRYEAPAYIYREILCSWGGDASMLDQIEDVRVLKMLVSRPFGTVSMDAWANKLERLLS